MYYLRFEYGASIDHAVNGAAQGGNQPYVDELILQGADKNWAIQGAEFGKHLSLVVHLRSQCTISNPLRWRLFALPPQEGQEEPEKKEKSLRLLQLKLNLLRDLQNSEQPEPFVRVMAF